MITVLVTTFITVFIAELGDKTQLATLAISGTSKRPLAVFLGSSSALIMASLLGVIAGGSITSVIPSDLLKAFAALGFMIIGIKLLWPLTKRINNIIESNNKLKPDDDVNS